MQYYSDITNQLYQTLEQLFKAERDYKAELVAKVRAEEKAKKIADLEAQLAELRGETAEKTTTAPNCNKRVKPDAVEDNKRGKMADSEYYSSAYVNLNGKEFYAEGADSWNDVKKAVREYFEKLRGMK